MAVSLIKKGFTLVELSIVMVIIGLLISGILIAQSIIETVKVHKIIEEYQQFQIATNNFVYAFQQLPGDYDNAISLGLTREGNGDGVIENADGRAEPLDYFLHLSKAKMLPVNLSQYSPGPTPPVVGKESMEGKAIAGSYWEAKSVVYYDSGTNYSAFPWYPLIPSTENDYHKNFFIYSIHENDSAYNTAGGIPVTIAMSVDAKMDDGISKSGNVRGGSGWMEPALSDCNDGNNLDWNNSFYRKNSRDGCAIVIKLENYQ